jgi:hypothetical protein
MAQLHAQGQAMMESHWQHMAALILWKCKGSVRLVVSKRDIERFAKEFAPGFPTLYHRPGKEAIEFQVVTEARGTAMVAADAQPKGTS